MVNALIRLFNSIAQKLQKSGLSTGRHALAHSLPNEVHGGRKMKKGLISIVVLVVLMVTAIPASAQTRYRRYDGRRYEQRYDGRRSRDWDRRDRSVWDRHRDKLTTAAGAGAGALVGAMVG